MKNDARLMSGKNLSAPSSQHGERDARNSDATAVIAATSTASCQSESEFGGGYSSLTGSQRLGVTDLGRGEVRPSVATTFAGPNERLMACHRYSRVVRVLAVIDAMLVLFGASAFTPLILMIWGPIAGYLSSNFKLRASYTFLFYYGLRVAWDIGWLLSGGITWIVVWVFLFTDVAALGLVYFYLALLRRCTEAEREQLRNPNTAWASAFFPLTVSGSPSREAL
ncbi:unnamed protein product [Pylaiella littoralis]